MTVPGSVVNPEHDPDLPPMPALPPADSTRDRWFMRVMSAQPAWFGPAVTEYARAYAKLAVLAERERVALIAKERNDA